MFECLSDGDRKAYYESSQWVIKQNRQKISNMRKEVKDLRVLKAKKLAVSNLNTAYTIYPHTTYIKYSSHTITAHLFIYWLTIIGYLFQADEVVVNKGLENNEKERNALRDKPGSVSYSTKFPLMVMKVACMQVLPLCSFLTFKINFIHLNDNTGCYTTYG